MSGVDVTGGTGSVEVDIARVRHLAGVFGHGGRDTFAAVYHLHGYLVDPDLATSTLFDPAGMAAFEWALGLALDGPQGLSWVGVRCEFADGLLRAGATAYATADSVVDTLHDAVIGQLEMVPAVGYFTYEFGRTHDFTTSLQKTITKYPEMADRLVPLVGVAAAGLSTLPGGAAVAGAILQDGHGDARRTGNVWGTDPTGAAGRPPRTLSDVITSLAQRDDDPHSGAVDIRFLQRPDGSRKVIVEITGTRTFTPLPTADITSLVTNAKSLVGRRTSYEDGVLKAMRDAGVTQDDDVMLVGHSEGGMVAVTTARDAVRSKQFHVTHVVTAGSPIGLTAGSLPRSVQVLALENSHDVVPHLDGVANPDQRNVVTARAAHGNGTIGDNHSLRDGYVPLAHDVDHSGDGALRDYLHGCKDYFDATDVTTRTYQIARHY